MPIYAYRAREVEGGCKVCSDTFEVTHGMDEPRLEACPKCGQPVQRIISGVNVVQGHVMGEGLSRERLKKSGLRKMVRGDDGQYHDDTPK